MAKVARRSIGIRFMLGLALTWALAFIVEVTAEKFDQSVAILLAAKDGPAGDLALQEWSTYLRQSDVQAAVWVVCLANTGRGTLVDKFSNLVKFPVNEDQSWSTAMRNFRLMNPSANIFGLLGEGVLPPPDLSSTILNMKRAITAAAESTVVLARSRSRSMDKNTPGTWLPDTFIAQLWCNRRMLTGSGLEDLTLVETSFLQMLPIFIVAHRAIAGLVEVDGTSVIKATYDMPAGEWASLSRGNTAAADGGNLYIGKLSLVLIKEERDDNDQVIANAKIEAAPWPPRYVLDTVQGEDGLVILNNVNCGYLDFATNFLRSVRRVTNSKKDVMWVAMDELAFDFMDALSPGTVVLFSHNGTERHHAIKAGSFGDETFKTQVLVRPNILLHILNQGYTVLWTDSDMVWMDNPLPLLPDMNDPEAAELLLQYDGSAGNVCTCFLFMKPTKSVKRLMELWIQSIIETNSFKNQGPFKQPLHQQLEAGMRMDVFPEKSFPSGSHFFSHPYEEDYAHVYYPDIIIVHNNFVQGHNRKLERFQKYHLWDVENMTFPTCERRNRL